MIAERKKQIKGGREGKVDVRERGREGGSRYGGREGSGRQVGMEKI